ncbi:host specificity protein J, partial [Pseudodesulfovibrio sp. JC047]|uniref:host specificity protein J n=1 Tax=Pseudodesulfovibrio sp. JC047 TaxID=2683199 RepID=UPI0013D2D3C2
MTNILGVYGSGGGGGGGGGHVPIEEPNDLRSRATTRAIGVLSEGEIGGLVDGAKSIYFDSTPLQAADGSYNFQGVKWWERKGTPDQEHIPGFASVENELEVAAVVAHDTPVVRTITNTEVDAVRVRVHLNALVVQNGSGDLVKGSVEWAVDVRVSGGDWVEKLRDTIKGKTTSEYERAYRIELNGVAPWDIRVRRITEDSDTAKTQDELSWAAYTEVIDAKLIYPDTAVMGLSIDAEEFGNSIPSVSFEVKGLLLQVPSNYDPETRTYTGMWDGSFKRAWSDNPAWGVYEILTREWYGDDAIAWPDQVDKWTLYEISKYCDELVPDGYGGMEPRFRLNCVLQTQEDAYHVINSLISVCRGMTYWGSGAVAFSQDAPGEPSHYAAPANVENGDFKYKSTSRAARHTVALVTWNDPADNYKPTVEVVEDVEGIAKYGWNPVDVAEIGCIFRGQAHRKGKWILDSELNETKAVSFVGGFEFADAAPGCLVEVTDPVVAGVRMGGRLKAAEASAVVLDAPVTIEAGEGYVLTVALPDKTTADAVVVNDPGETSTLIFETPLQVVPEPGAMWVLTATNLAPRLFRVLSNREADVHKFEITAMVRDPNKFDRVEQNIKFDPKPTSLIPSGPIPKPTAPAIDEYL